jgi:kojibiose phosphorylase
MSAAHAWTIVNARHDAANRAQHNSVFTISNGYLGLKGNLQEDRDAPCPVTLINGVYDEIDQFGTLRMSNGPRPYLDPEYFDSAGKSPAVANLPNPLAVRVFVENREISFAGAEITGFRQSLDLRTGLYRYYYNHRDAAGRVVRIEMQRFAALRHAHRVFMRYTVTPIKHAARLRILSGIDAHVHANTTLERQFVVRDAEVDAGGRCALHVRTNARKHDVHLAVEHVCRGASLRPASPGIVEHDAVYLVHEGWVPAESPITIDRVVVLTSSEDQRYGAAVSLEDELAAASSQGFDSALEEQGGAWQALWERADVGIEGDEPAQQALRFCVYHLLAAAPWHTDKLSVPVKLLTGEYYQGNTFWDTDLYVVPFYVFTCPDRARACLDFRHTGLKCARAIARELGYDGAKLAWQAGPYGDECLGPWYRFARTNIHINADVVYSLMQYYWASGDEGFMGERGIDILVETARFYQSRAAYDVECESLTFEEVAGPDEAHCQSTSNFYTNYLAKRSLLWAAHTLDHLHQADPAAFERAAKRLKLEAAEAQAWRETADQLILLYDAESRLYEQCAGFFQLPPVPSGVLDDRREWFGPIYSYQAMNQPDVVMALTLFRDDFDGAVRRANWEYYKDRCMNFSSMSFAVNAIAAADAGDLDEAYRNFRITAGMDLDEKLTGRHDTHAGLHGTAMGGAWLAAVFGFGGVCLSERGLRINPNLPPQWNALRFSLMLRGEVVNVAIERSEITLRAGDEGTLELPLTVAGNELVLRSGQTLRVPYGGGNAT